MVALTSTARTLGEQPEPTDLWAGEVLWHRDRDEPDPAPPARPWQF
jgi:hypothetical protein